MTASWLLWTWLFFWTSCEAWIAPWWSRTPAASLTALRYADDGHGDAAVVRRTSVAGVSVAADGFWMVLRTGEDAYWPIQVTSDLADARSASSPEALTLLQLLARVDMAGALLPPDALAKLVIYECEADPQGPVAEDLLAIVAQRVAKTSSLSLAFSEQPAWTQSRIALPQVTLDEVRLDANLQFEYHCRVKDLGAIQITPRQEVIADIVYRYQPNVSPAFLALALALRYRAPVVAQGLEEDPSSVTLEELRHRFPLYRSTSDLQQTSQRVVENIERGFEVNKLQAALRMARERGDEAAAVKIRQRLDQLDSLDDLPVQADSDMSSME